MCCCFLHGVVIKEASITIMVQHILFMAIHTNDEHVLGNSTDCNKWVILLCSHGCLHPKLLLDIAQRAEVQKKGPIQLRVCVLNCVEFGCLHESRNKFGFHNLEMATPEGILKSLNRISDRSTERVISQCVVASCTGSWLRKQFKNHVLRIFVHSNPYRWWACLR